MEAALVAADVAAKAATGEDPRLALLARFIEAFATQQAGRDSSALWTRAVDAFRRNGMTASAQAGEQLRGIIAGRRNAMPWRLGVAEGTATVAREADCPPVAARALIHAGQLHRDGGRMHKALACLRAAEEQHRLSRKSASSPAIRTETCLLLASVCRILGDWEVARLYLDEVESLVNLAEHPGVRAALIRARALHLYAEGRLTEAVIQLEAALDAWLRLKDSRRVGEVHVALGEIRCEQGEFARAFQHYREALRRYRNKPLFGHTTRAYLGMGLAYGRLGQMEQWSACCDKAQAAATTAEAPLLEGEVELARAQMALARQDMGTAIVRLRAAATEFAAIPAPHRELQSTITLAACLLRSRQQEDVFPLLDRAAEQARRIGDRIQELQAVLLRGEALARARRWPEALVTYQGALDLARRLGKRPDEARLLSDMGVALVHLRRYPEAEQRFNESTKAVEALRVATGGNTSVGIYLGESLRSLLLPYLHFLQERERLPEAFAQIQRMKARMLWEHIAQSGQLTLTRATEGVGAPAASSAPLLERKLREEVTSTNARLMALQAANVSETDSRIAVARAAFLKAERALSRLLDGFSAQHPADATRRAARTPSVAEIGTRVAPGDLVLEFARISDSMLLLIAWWRTGNRQEFWRSVTIPRAALSRAIDDFRRACATDDGWSQPNRRLTDLLFPEGQVRKAISQAHRLYICPTDDLWGLPFGALALDGDIPLLQEHEIVLNYSATTLAVIRGKRSEAAEKSGRRTACIVAIGDFSAIALPDRGRAAGGVAPHDLRLTSLPAALPEGRVVQSALPGSVFLPGARATRLAVLREAGRHPVLHVATHCLVNDAAPLYSSLVLHPEDPVRNGIADPFLTARDLLEQDLSRVEVAVLSACRSGSGASVAGEGILGFAWALLAAGCGALIASPWTVQDKATAHWMKAFYEALGAGDSLPGAVRTAALTTRREARFRNPRHWAAFQLIGAP